MQPQLPAHVGHQFLSSQAMHRPQPCSSACLCRLTHRPMAFAEALMLMAFPGESLSMGNGAGQVPHKREPSPPWARALRSGDAPALREPGDGSDNDPEVDLEVKDFSRRLQTDWEVGCCTHPQHWSQTSCLDKQMLNAHGIWNAWSDPNLLA